MKLIQLQQGTREWLDYRSQHINSSEAATICGKNPWETPYGLWKRRREGREIPVNEKMRRGTRLEPIARRKLEEALGIVLPPAVGQHDVRTWQSSSFDGLNLSSGTVSEIKCGSLELHEMARRGEMPGYYMYQCQHHFAVSEIARVVYGSYYVEEGYPEDSGEIIYFDVCKDQSMIHAINASEEDFYEMLLREEAPPLTARDYEEFDDEEASKLLKIYQDLGEQENTISKQRDEVKKKLMDICPENNFILDGVKVYQSQTYSYDFEKMREQGIDLQKYKKVSKPYWKIGPRPKQS